MRPRLSLLALALLLPLAACDTNDPEPSVTPADVAGLYDFVEFRFVPQAQAITPADVLARLDSAQTFLDLLATSQGGRFQLRYKFPDDLLNLINGTFTVTQTRVTLTVDEAYRGLLPDLLLDPTITFSREGASTLVLDQQKTVNLQAYDPDQYGGAGLTAVQGRLVVRLERRSAGGR